MRAFTPSSSWHHGKQLIHAMFLLGVTLYMLIGDPMMTLLGIPYSEATGSPIFKIHIATYLLILTFILGHMLRGNALQSMFQQFRENPGITTYLFCTILMAMYSVGRYGTSGAAFIVDTLMMPAICAFTMLMFDDRGQRRVYLLILAIIVINSLIAIVESVLQVQFIPFTIGGKPVVNELYFRSTALLGHPLTNALITGTVLMTLLGLRNGIVPRALLFGILYVAIVSFGGRTGFALTALLLCFYFVCVVTANLVRGRYTYLRIMSGIVAAFFTVGILASVVLGTSLGDRIVDKLFTYDNSASVRVHNWAALDFMSMNDLLFGMSPNAIEYVIYRLHYRYNVTVIENFWLGLTMQVGLVGLSLFVIGLFAVLFQLWRRSEGAGKMAIAYFLIVASANNSLSTKNIAMTVMFLAVRGGAA
ncbi:MAG: VpsF family polysaccharide biosynthesis protein [Burkholderiaceae bacterium]